MTNYSDQPAGWLAQMVVIVREFLQESPYFRFRNYSNLRRFFWMKIDCRRFIVQFRLVFFFFFGGGDDEHDKGYKDT